MQLAVKHWGILDWWEVKTSHKDGWSFVTTIPGALSVIMVLVLKMQLLHVDNWDSLMKASSQPASYEANVDQNLRVYSDR